MRTCGSVVLVAGYSCMVAVASNARTFSSVFSFSFCYLGRRERVAGPVPQV